MPRSISKPDLAKLVSDEIVCMWFLFDEGILKLKCHTSLVYTSSICCLWDSKPLPREEWWAWYWGLRWSCNVVTENNRILNFPTLAFQSRKKIVLIDPSSGLRSSRRLLVQNGQKWRSSAFSTRSSSQCTSVTIFCFHVFSLSRFFLPSSFHWYKDFSHF